MATKKTTKKSAKGGATKPSMLNRIYTSFEQVTDAYNEVRDDLINLGILWRGSKLDKVECFYEPVYSDKPAPDIDPDNWELDCVSPYAATETHEDFAETFIRHCRCR